MWVLGLRRLSGITTWQYTGWQTSWLARVSTPIAAILGGRHRVPLAQPIILFPTLPNSVPAESDSEQNHDDIVAGCKCASQSGTSTRCFEVKLRTALPNPPLFGIVATLALLFWPVATATVDL